ncbi:hypothetical protein GUITHDRAFT_137389 [Guillardia theta CCMP2712]|uniref:Zn(2)-C6 fungal-type domain-containing protein n=1 Tax=Guillardia theta (strain CCMP2712) TaxID=905079 RepID=L1JHP5_GUITC|nr:hypothetical protein GUITHDRAFT_137389 [Guillardia theta CCMP2712]EKX47620.1 hypothetical protein GUITHDRAFT_137389 [Guillardia theta CCMP2712]|eukprot:XP_005834600.1 hypothetical protein GUITHDRAFT_137389 [Guillardia theta CCMP2712]
MATLAVPSKIPSPPLTPPSSSPPSRQRVAAACWTCKLRKLKCDDARPCTRCFRSGWGRFCVPCKRSPRKAAADKTSKLHSPAFASVTFKPPPALSAVQPRKTKIKRRQVSQACDACRRSKVGCDESRPCKRCARTQQDCSGPPLSSQPLTNELFSVAVCMDTGAGEAMLPGQAMTVGDDEQGAAAASDEKDRDGSWASWLRKTLLPMDGEGEGWREEGEGAEEDGVWGLSMGGEEGWERMERDERGWEEMLGEGI